MKNFLRHYPPLDPLRRPFDCSSPFSRIDFWIFYLGYILLGSVSLVLIESFTKTMDPGARLDIILGAIFLAGMLLWFAYLAIAMLCATARRMKDSGYRRLGLILSVALGASTMGSITSDIQSAYRVGAHLLPEGGNIPFTPASIYLGMATVVSLVYVFLGTVRRSHKADEKTKTQEDRPG